MYMCPKAVADFVVLPDDYTEILAPFIQLIFYQQSSTGEKIVEVDFVEYDASKSNYNWLDGSRQLTTLPSNTPNIDCYIIVDPANHTVKVAYNTLSNIIATFTDAVRIPSEMYLSLRKWQWQPSGTEEYSSTDTSIEGGNIIVPPENWQYA